MQEHRVIEQWLHDRPATTQANYALSIRQFKEFVKKPLAEVSLEDIQGWSDSLGSLKPTTRRNKLAAVKSLLAFAVEVGAIAKSPAAAVRLKVGRMNLAGRILTRDQVRSLLDVPGVQDKAVLSLLYGTGARASEVCSLTWADLQERDGGDVQCRFQGKGGKARVVILPEQVWGLVRQLRGDRPQSSPVFGLNRYGVWAVVKAAARRAGLAGEVSPHWLRHAHAQHALAGGAPLQLVRDTLGHSSIAVTNVYLESNPEDSSSNYLGL